MIEDSTLPLTGVRIADFTWVGAGPFMTKPLADHGAEVIKVESRGRTDVIRTMPPFRDGAPGINRSGYFANRNTSKKSICLELQTETGRAVALELIARSDVVVNNFTPGTMARFGLGYEDARRVRPDIIYLDMPMQGLVGPYRGHRGYGLSIGALAGFYDLCGYPDEPPVGSGTNYPDHVPNPLHGAVAILSALHRRARTGAGAHIEVAQIESTVNVIGSALLAQAAGRPAVRRGNGDDRCAPHGVYPCRGADQACAIAVRSDAEWQVVAGHFGPGSGLHDPRFVTAEGRRAAADELERRLAMATTGEEAGKLADALCAAGVAAARVADAGHVVRDDEQLRARGHWVVLDHEEMGLSLYDNVPYRLSATPGRLRSAAPLLGEHTRDVCLQVLGMDERAYEAAVAEGAIG